MSHPSRNSPVAYSSATGAQLWARRYNGPGNGTDTAFSVAVSPTGTAVFVTGYSYGGPATYNDFAAIAYRAATGEQLWVRRYNNSAARGDYASQVAVSRDGTQVFVTGSSRTGPGTLLDYVTVAYNATTGARLWAKRYNGPGSAPDAGNMIFCS